MVKKTYIAPEILEVRLQHNGIICTSPGGYDNQNPDVIGGGTIGDEGGVWTKESKNLWDEEW